jgi:hypothetical protein
VIGALRTAAKTGQSNCVTLATRRFYCSSQNGLPHALLLLVLRLQQRDGLSASEPSEVLDRAPFRRFDAAVDVDGLAEGGRRVGMKWAGERVAICEMAGRLKRGEGRAKCGVRGV